MLNAEYNYMSPYNTIVQTQDESSLNIYPYPELEADKITPYDPLKPLVNNYLKTNISMYDNRGKYFDSYLFNQKFDQYIKQTEKNRFLKQKIQLQDLNSVKDTIVNPYQLPFDEILINIKNTWFNLYDNILYGRNIFDNLNQNDFFYIGITLIVIALLYTTLSFIFN